MAINVLVEGTQGKGVKDLGSKGYAAIQMKDHSYMNEHQIIVDAFQGRGDDFKERENERITITSNSKSFTFNSFEELVNRLKPTSLTIEELKKNIEREIQLIPEDGVNDGFGTWTSKEDEEKRLNRFCNDLVYFMREYS